MFEDDPPASGNSEVGVLVADNSLVPTRGLSASAGAEISGGAPVSGGAPTSGDEQSTALRSSFAGGPPFSEAGAAALDRLSSDDLLELLAAWDRVEAQAAAGKRAVAAALEERFAPRIVPGRQGRVEIKGQAACEVAIRLGISQQRASLLVGEGVLFNGVLADVGVALAEGVIDAGKAALFAKVLGDQDPSIAFAVMDTVLPSAPGKPHARLEKALNAELIRVDPAAASKRFERAMRLRRLEQVQLRPDGMASIRLVASVVDAAWVYVYADSTARATKAAGDDRTLDQLRADTLLALVADHPLPPAGSDGPGAGPNPGSGPKPGGPDGPGALPVDELGDVRRLITGLRGKSSGKKIEDALQQLSPQEKRPPLVRATGPASRLTLILASAHLQPPGDDPPCLADSYRDDLYASPPDSGMTDGDMTDGDAPAIALPAGPSSPAPSCPSAVLEGPPAVLAEPPAALPTPPALLAGAAARLGRDVPHLLGFGPIDPVTARTLIAQHPTNLTVKIYEDVAAEHVDWLAAAPEDRHDPCPALQRHLAAYYPTCIAPTSAVRATVCDNDHVIEYPLGPTHVTNLRPLCRYHHLIKTHAGHRLELDETGTLIWITALGTRRPTQHQRR